MRPLAMVLAMAGLGIAAAAVFTARSQLVEPDEPPVTAPAEAAPAEPALARSPIHIRPVAPDIIAMPPVAAETLERVAPREPLSPIGRAISPSEGPPKETVLFRPLISQAGVFRSLGHSVVLAGIEPTPAAETCVSDGVEWPCGVHARTAFRNLLRGRAPSCVVPAVPGDEPVVTACKLGRIDPAEWLVAQGWVRAVPDGPYAALGAEAHREGRGIFGPAPSLSQ